MTIKSGIHIIPLHIYPSNVYLIINEPNDVVSDFLKSRLVTDDEINLFVDRQDNEPGLSILFSTGNACIRLKAFTDSDIDKIYGVIAHESFHAAVRVMGYIGTEFSEETEEPFAYLIEYIFNEICKKIQ